MRSNVTVGPPIDLMVYGHNALRITRHRRFHAKDPDLLAIQTHWEQALRKAVQELPPIRFEEPGPSADPRIRPADASPRPARGSEAAVQPGGEFRRNAVSRMARLRYPHGGIQSRRPESPAAVARGSRGEPRMSQIVRWSCPAMLVACLAAGAPPSRRAAARSTGSTATTTASSAATRCPTSSATGSTRSTRTRTASSPAPRTPPSSVSGAPADRADASRRRRASR